MKNCLVAQSGGPTAVINASVVGILQGNIDKKYYDKVFGGFNGIEGILKDRLIDLTNLSSEELQVFKHTPSSGLGSCRYKIKDYLDNDEEYIRFFEILDQHNIQTFFYIGGNDSMDTVNKFSKYAKEHGINKQIIGIPKTVDNDLMVTDHTPGFGSAAKYIAQRTLETYLDSSVYVYNGVAILETMGRDTGWLAASSSLARINGKPVADLIYLPEVPFCKEQFIEDVRKIYEEKNKVFIVASEGLKDSSGKYLSEMETSNEHDEFGHAKLGGLGGYLKTVIDDAGITSRVKVLELGVAQRAAMCSASARDIDSAFTAGYEAFKFSTMGDTGFMAAIKRVSNNPYKIEIFKADPEDIANHIKYFPIEWINKEGNHVEEDAFNYILPLIMGQPELVMENGLPKYIEFEK